MRLAAWIWYGVVALVGLVGFGFAVLQIDNRMKPLFSEEHFDV